MATHSSILAWRIPWTEEPGGLQSTGPHRVGRDGVTNTFTFMLRGLLIPCPGAEPAPLALEGQRLNPWTAGEGPAPLF